MIKLAFSSICLCLVIPVIPLKIFEKLSKYKVLEIEVTKTWHFKSLVIGALDVVAKTVPNHVLQIPGVPSLTEHSCAPHISCGRKFFFGKLPM